MRQALRVAVDLLLEARRRKWFLALFGGITLVLVVLGFSLELEVVDGALAGSKLFGSLLSDDIVSADRVLARGRGAIRGCYQAGLDRDQLVQHPAADPVHPAVQAQALPARPAAKGLGVVAGRGAFQAVKEYQQGLPLGGQRTAQRGAWGSPPGKTDTEFHRRKQLCHEEY